MTREIYRKDIRLSTHARPQGFKYSVTDEVLDKFVDLLRSWGIREKDWMLATDNAIQRFGYPSIDTNNPHEIDIEIDRRVVPWPVEKVQWTCLPPARSKWFRDYNRFVASTGFTPHIVAYPFGPLLVKDITKSPWYILPSGRRIHIHPPEVVVKQQLKLLCHPLIGSNFRSRIPRWKKRTIRLHTLAKARRDYPVIRACETFLKTLKKIQIQDLQQPLNDHLKGAGIGNRTVCGKVRIIKGEKQFKTFCAGEILVAEDTNPVFLPLIRRAAAILTSRGGITSHAATLAREFRIPCVIGMKGIIKFLKTGDLVKVDTKRGIVQKIK